MTRTGARLLRLAAMSRLLVLAPCRARSRSGLAPQPAEGEQVEAAAESEAANTDEAAAETSAEEQPVDEAGPEKENSEAAEPAEQKE